MKNVRALIFDLDGTLYDADAAYRLALETIGIDITGEEYCNARALVKSRLPRGHVSARNRLLYFRQILINRGQFSAKELLRMMTAYEQALEQEVERQWCQQGYAELLSRISQKYPMVILTNENVRTQMLKLRVIDSDGTLFKGAIVSEEEGVEKPARQMFDAASALLHVPLEACMMIGDSWEIDIQPSLELGCAAAWTREFIRTSKSRCEENWGRLTCIDCLMQLSNELML